MFCSDQISTSAYDVPAIFCVASILIALFTWRVTRGRPAVRIRHLLLREEGASYAIAVAISIPFYCLMIATVIECAMLMQVRIGTMYAAFAAARAAVVWMPAEVTPGDSEDMVKLAAAQALAPFASSKQIHLEPTGAANDDTDGGGRAYWEAYRAYSGGAMPRDYWTRKRQYALAATEVTIEKQEVDRKWQEPVATIIAKVVYEKPIDLPVVGSFLGQRASWPGANFYSRKIEAKWAMQLEGPKSTSGKLGIHYDSWDY